MVFVIVDNIASNESPDAIAAAYHITTQDVQAALHYAANLTRERSAPRPGGA